MRTIIGIGVGSILTLSAIVMGTAHATQDPGHGRKDIPSWVVRPCAHVHSVNCRFERPGKPVQINRLMPGGTGMVCVFYPAHLRRDYCA